MHYVYYGTPEALSQQESYHFKKYVKRQAFHSFQHFRIDEAVFTPVNLDCQNCRLVHPTSCCENGKPYTMLTEAELRLQQHASAIIHSYLTMDKQKTFKLSGYFEQSDTFPRYNQIKTCSQGNCFFYDQKGSICSIHRYALDVNLNPLELKPFSCILFPLEIIQDGGLIYLTSLTEETRHFSRWGFEYEGYLCINRGHREASKKLPKEIFSLEAYRPAWEWNRTLLQHSFGEELVEFISTIK